MSPNGAGQGQWPWMLKTKDITLYVSGGHWNGIASVRFSSHYLWSCRSVLEAIVSAQTFLDDLFKTEMFLQVSSVDLCVDVAGWEDVERLDRVQNFISRSRKRTVRDESEWATEVKSREYSVGFQRTGYDFARGKHGLSSLSCRMYDKSRELVQSGKEWFVDLWRSHGWSEDDGCVWRVEFSFKREALHELQQENTSHEVVFWGIEDAYELPERLPVLWAYATGQVDDGPDGLPDGWLRCVVPNGDKNRSRWPTHPVWQLIQTAFLDPMEVPPQFGKIMRKRWQEHNIDKGIEAVMGYLTLAVGPKQTVKQFLEHWLEEVHKPNIRQGSYVRYRTNLKYHILPVIGDVQLQRLTSQQVQSLYSQKIKEGLSASYIHSIHGLLHEALDQAVKWKLISINPCDSVTLPRLVRYEIHPLTREQAQKMLSTAKGHPLEGLLTMALATGMRKCELLCLRWEDVNLDDMSLQVRRTVAKYKGGYVESEPKTAGSRRKIILPQFVIDTLKQHRVHQLEARLKMGDAWIDRDLVFCNVNGDYYPFATLDQQFKALLKKAGLPLIRFHDLRHSAATLLLTMGVHPKVVQELLGHSQIRMTLDTYSHVLPSMQQEAMSKLDDVFRRNSGKDDKKVQ